MKNKRIVSLICAVVVLAGVFSACSKPSQVEIPTSGDGTVVSGETTKKEKSTAKKNTVFYDRLGEAHNSLYELPYYSEDGKIFYYHKGDGNTSVFIDKQKNEYDVERCYINAKGYFVYDEAGDIALDETALGAKDKKGRTYYPAVTIRWTNDGYMQTVFGMGKTVKQLDDDVDID